MITKPTKYTKKYVLDEVKELLLTLRANKGIVFLGELLVDKPYSMQRISEWNGLGGEISETIEKIKDILQSRAVVGGLKNDLSANMTKFHLINNYNWHDKQEIDHTTKGESLNFDENQAKRIAAEILNGRGNATDTSGGEGTPD